MSLTHSIEFDQEQLYKEATTGSIAHAKMLSQTEDAVIPQEDADLIVKTLKEILADIEAGKVEFTIESERYPYEYRKHPYRKDRRRRQEAPYCTKQK